MKKIKSSILKMSIGAKIICAVLVAALIGGAVFAGINLTNAQGVEPVETEKTYLADITDRIVSGKQKNFTILEIVPYLGVGEFRYFAGDPEVEAGILSKDQDTLRAFYGKLGNPTPNTWYKIQYLFSNFNYEIKYNSYQDKYYLRCHKTFNEDVLIEPYTSLLEGKIVVNTVEANDLTEDDLKEADLIVLSCTPQDNSTIQMYNFWHNGYGVDQAGMDTTYVYDKDGNMLPFGGINYSTYEKMEDGSLVSRDISWENAKTLLHYMETGRDLRGDGTLFQTPVILDARLSEQANHTSNMYKVALIYRMLESYQYEDFITNHTSTVDSEGNEFLSDTGIVTGALCYPDPNGPTVPETTTPETTVPETTTLPDETTSAGEETTTSHDETTSAGEETTPEETTTVIPPVNMIFKNDFTHEDIAKCVDISECIDPNPNAKKRLTNDYWVHNGDARLIPNNLAIVVSESQYAGLKDRGLDGKTVPDVVRYLLGCKEGYKVSYDFGKIRILEVEPCNSFKYDTDDKVIELGVALGLISNTTQWSKSPANANYYKNFLEVDCMTTRTLNCVTTDLISEYDAIIIGDQDNLLTKKNGETVYNDSSLNGYVYLAYGDYVKCGTTLYGCLEQEYKIVNINGGSDGTGMYAGATGFYQFNAGSDLKYAVTPPTSTRIHSSYGWGSFAGGSTCNDNSHYYNLFLNVNDATRFAFTDYQWSYLNQPKYTGSKTLVGLIEASSYFNQDKFKKNGNVTADKIYADPLGNMRLSGNDITNKVLEKLKDFSKAGKLFIVSDMVYDNDGTKIYPTSHIAEISNYLTDPGNRANLLKLSRLGGFAAHINAMSPILNFNMVPQQVTSSSYTNGILTSYLPNHDLSFAFSIDSYANTDYKVKFIIDKNGDGIYAEYKDAITDDRNEIFGTIMVTTDANGHADVSFTAELPPQQNGVVAYKIVVSMMKGDEETTLRSSYINFTSVRSQDDEEVRVLQLIPCRQYKNESYKNLNMKYNPLDNMSGNGYSQSNNDKNFRKYLDNITNAHIGYDIQVDTMTTAEFEKLFEGSENHYVKGSDYGTGKDPLSTYKYKMLVIGFGDTYDGDDISNLYGAVDCIEDYIENNNSVLFAHDTMSYNSTYNYFQINVNGNTSRMGASGAKRLGGGGIPNDKMCTQLSLNLRNAVGLDRYGITLAEGDREGKDVPMYYSGAKPSYATSNYVQELQGFSDWCIYRNAMSQSYTESYDSSTGVQTYKPFTGVNISSELWETNKVEKVNNGQITRFPYKIDDTISVQTTHPQYYQLDLEDDDLVVWYTLAYNGNSSSDMYGKNPKDGQNYYYIYSNGNVTYTGAGHRDIGGVTSEAQLFVNTIIKAIAAGNSAPEVVVTNGAKANVGYVIYTEPSKLLLNFKASDADLTTIEAVDGDYTKLGRFETGRVIWDVNENGVYDEGEDVIIQEYSRTGRILYNDLEYSINLNTIDTLNAAQKAEIADKVVGNGAYFILEATDYYGKLGSTTAKMTSKNLFEID